MKEEEIATEIKAKEHRFARVLSMGDEGVTIRTQPRLAVNNTIGIVKPGSVWCIVDRDPAWTEVVLMESADFSPEIATGFLNNNCLEFLDAAVSSLPAVPAAQISKSFVRVVDLDDDTLNVRTGSVFFDNAVITAVRPRTIFEFVCRDGEFYEVALANDSRFVGNRLTGHVSRECVRFMAGTADRQIINIIDQLQTHPSRTYTTRNLNDLAFHAVHHTASSRSTMPQTVAHSHVDSHGLPGIGYTFYIAADGTIFQTNRIATMSYATADQNHRVLSTVMAGRFINGVQPTPVQIDALRWLHFIHIPDVLGRALSLVGHCELPGQNTVCPGNSWDWHNLIE